LRLHFAENYDALTALLPVAPPHARYSPTGIVR